MHTHKQRSEGLSRLTFSNPVYLLFDVKHESLIWSQMLNATDHDSFLKSHHSRQLESEPACSFIEDLNVHQVLLIKW